MTIAEFLKQTTRTFEAAGVTTPRLDTQVLLERALNQNKAWLLAHGDDDIPVEKLVALQSQAARREAREPLAYIVGRQEFYGRNFSVTPDVLIPRPETEQLIETLKSLPLPDNASVLDVGTGSGAIAITAELELPHLRLDACDNTSFAALRVAVQNAERLQATVRFFHSDLLENTDHPYDCIVANLPYVADDWQRSPETNYEPAEALFAGDEGLALINKLMLQAPDKLHKKGYLLLEADPRQFEAIKKAASTSLTVVANEGFAIWFKKR